MNVLPLRIALGLIAAVEVIGLGVSCVWYARSAETPLVRFSLSALFAVLCFAAALALYSIIHGPA